MKSAATLAMPKIFFARPLPDRVNGPFRVIAAAPDSANLNESQKHG
ncbi:MAG: hypothetical protein Q7T21_07080 [Gallionella sp.]|nr:hypothetical protein [Gallionella sp.]